MACRGPHRNLERLKQTLVQAVTSISMETWRVAIADYPSRLHV